MSRPEELYHDLMLDETGSVAVRSRWVVHLEECCGGQPTACPGYTPEDWLTIDGSKVTCPRCRTQVPTMIQGLRCHRCRAFVPQSRDGTQMALCARCWAYRSERAASPPLVRPHARVREEYCEAAPPRAVVEAVQVRLDGPGDVTVPLVFSARMQVAWERHEAFFAAHPERPRRHYDRDLEDPESQDAFGGVALHRPNGNPYRCTLCGARMRLPPEKANG
jgi:hypothetical protein